MGEETRFASAGGTRGGAERLATDGQAGALAAGQGRAMDGNADATRVVSFDDEPLILVDAADREVGFLDKAAAHRGTGTLHRAFSLFIFDEAGRVLLQQRASGKRLWPGFWSNACCSHPRRGESLEHAIHRRLREELALVCPLEFLFKFEYQAQYDTDGAEHELCWVYAGRTADTPQVNVNEIAATRYVAPDALDAEIAQTPERFTPWFKLEWARIRREHAHLFATPSARRAGVRD